jgi:hypothetical protein
MDLIQETNQFLSSIIVPEGKSKRAVAVENDALDHLVDFYNSILDNPDPNPLSSNCHICDLIHTKCMKEIK